MTKVVLDTNVLVSALLSKHGNEALVLRIALSGGFEIYVSEPIMDEYRRVLAKPKLKIPLPTRRGIIDAFQTNALLVQPRVVVTASPDDADNRFLECAETAEADYLVTGNKRHFPARWKGTKVVNARELLDNETPL